MTARRVIPARQQQALSELTAILEKHDPEATTRLGKTNHGNGVLGSTKRPLENATYLAESLLILAQIVDRELTPKKRGRPRKST